MMGGIHVSTKHMWLLQFIELEKTWFLRITIIGFDRFKIPYTIEASFGILHDTIKRRIL